MGIINRFLLFLYTLFIAVLSIGVILLVVKLVPEQYVINEYQYLTAQWQTAAGALLFFLLSIHLLCCSLFNGSKEQVSRNDIILVNTDKQRIFNRICQLSPRNQAVMLAVTAAVGVVAVRIAGKDTVYSQEIRECRHFERDTQINIAFFFPVGGYSSAVHASVSGINNKRICSHRTVSAHGGIARKDNKRRCREDRNGRKHRRHLNKAFKLNRNKHKITQLTNYVRGVIIISFGYEFFKAVKALFDILH